MSKEEFSQCGKYATRACPNCNEQIASNKPGHFVPPSLGEAGFYICAKQKEKENQADGSKH